METTESQAIGYCQKGQLEYYGQLYNTYLKRIYDFLYFRTHHKQTAEDLTSQVFFKALEKIDKFDSRKGQFSTWLYQIARNTLIDHYRTAKANTSLEDAWDIPSGSDVLRDADTALKLEQVKKYLAGLSPLQRDIVLMRVWDGLPYKEIAEILGISEANAKMTFSRVLDKLNRQTAFAAISLLLTLISQ